MIFETITSKQNLRIKNIIHLQKHSERINQGVFIIEGLKEIEKAVLSDYIFDSVYFNDEIFPEEKLKDFFGKSLPGMVFKVSSDVYSRIAYRENQGGLVVLAKPKTHKAGMIKFKENPLVLVVEGVEKPGNIGAIFRTADAAGIDAVMICDPKADIYNPNAIRASLGCVFTVPSVVCSSDDGIQWLKSNNVRIFCTHLKAAKPYHEMDFTKPSAIVMGTEDKGLTEIWTNEADANIIIPMCGAADSMNVSVSAAIVIFEAKRQRNFL
ncbi:MAG: hypothetical protein A2W91_03735 [Bacteroidetes bacterium GWF2_38_335]|nr:MAG: hypothetical protein A2W91_03735 [Bacteroidetes bacterium GWF2_38_335]OFY77405.1 MAG: hypothetical protein A2281_01025 [Bacteroidetes bacterium RIFOXYA12_FULL_38_20]HBS87307.1 rRNA methyltransferase [Bacteroidales bacterium]